MSDLQKGFLNGKRKYNKIQLENETTVYLGRLLKKEKMVSYGIKDEKISRLLCRTGLCSLSYGKKIRGITCPEIIDAGKADVIVIPGLVRKDDETARENFECKILKKYHGHKPIILLCGAMWRLKVLDVTVGDVKFHANSHMLSLNGLTGSVTHNTSIHTVKVEKAHYTKKIKEHNDTKQGTNKQSIKYNILK